METSNSTPTSETGLLIALIEATNELCIAIETLKFIQKDQLNNCAWQVLLQRKSTAWDLLAELAN